MFVDVNLLEGGDNEGGCFSGAVFGTGEDVAFGEGKGDGFFLDGRGLFEAGLEDAHEEFTSDGHVLEFEALGCGDIFCLWARVPGWGTQTRFPS